MLIRVPSGAAMPCTGQRLSDRPCDAAADQPCFEQLESRLLMAATRVAVIGSSSVDGIEYNGSVGNSFRRPLWRTLRADGYDVNFLGSKNTNYGKAPANNDFDRDNEGHAGWHAGHFLTGKDGVASLATLLNGSSSDGVAYTPDIAIIYVGHNDIFNNQTPASTANEIAQIIEVLRDDNPNVTVIVGLLHNTGWTTPKIKNANANADIAELNDLLVDLADSKNTSASRVVTVDINSGFNPATMTLDGHHPDSDGEAYIAARFYSRIINFLPGTVQVPIVVTPTSGLVTTENGGTATFTVALAYKPQFNVTITLSSSDTGEGTINKTSLTFTPDNWNTAQTVTVTGKNDSVLDGTASYTIVTNAASSTDPGFDDINPPNISVANLDDEVPPDTVGNTIDTAKNLGAKLRSPLLVSEHVGDSDATDFYRIRIRNASRLRLRLNGVYADARIQLLDDNGTRMRSKHGVRTANRRIDADRLTKGVYFIRVFSRDGLDTPYSLNIVRKNLA